jgi:hypothetical protein
MKRAVFASLLTTLVLSLSVPTVALAQKKKGRQESAESSGQKKVKTYDFSGDEIDGDLIKPDGEFVDARNFAKHTSLIRIRKDFIKEILKSAEDL